MAYNGVNEEQKEMKKEGQFGSFNQFLESILRKRDLDSLLEELLKKLTAVFGAERSTFYFYNEETKELWSYIATDLEIASIRVPLGSGVAGRAAAEHKVINVKEAYKYKFFNSAIDKKTGFRTRNILASPLVNKEGALLGVVQLLNKKGGPFSAVDKELIKSISYYIVVALENIKLLQEKETFVRSTIYALTGALDAKDPITSGHSFRVAYFSLKIARALGYAEEKINTLEYAAYLHDVGKIGVSDSILQKKERLTPGEYQAMREHPLYTLKILKNILFPKANIQIPEIAASHHEFLDGSGYPAGLKGEQINMLSRIIAVADIYDALVSFDRPYKKHLSIKEALRILREEGDKKHLDKKIVSLFIKKELYNYERRSYQRMDLDTMISFQVIPQRRVIGDKLKEQDSQALSGLEILKQASAKTQNISEGGVLLLLKKYLAIGTYLDLRLEVAAYRIRCIGKIVWVEKISGTDNYRAGISFINLSGKIKAKLSKAIITISSDKKR